MSSGYFKVFEETIGELPMLSVENDTIVCNNVVGLGLLESTITLEGSGFSRILELAIGTESKVERT